MWILLYASVISCNYGVNFVYNHGIVVFPKTIDHRIIQATNICSVTLVSKIFHVRKYESKL